VQLPRGPTAAAQLRSLQPAQTRRIKKIQPKRWA